MASHYNVIFAGRTLPGKEMDSVKMNLMNLLKTDSSAIDHLFSGKPVLIKKNLTAENAQKYQEAFEAAGAVCTLQPISTTQEAKGSPAAQKKEESSPWVHSAENGNMIMTNIENVPGKTIVEHFGLVSGSTIRAKHVGRDLMASLKNLVGGEIKSYTKLLQESRQQAVERMMEQARQLGANAIINIRFSTSSVTQGAAELYAYGTAVRVK